MSETGSPESPEGPRELIEEILEQPTGEILPGFFHNALTAKAADLETNSMTLTTKKTQKGHTITDTLDVEMIATNTNSDVMSLSRRDTG